MKRIPYSGTYFFHFYFNYIWNLVVKSICLLHNLIVDRKHKICFPNHNACWVTRVLPLLGLCFLAWNIPGSSHWAVLISHGHSLICFSFGKAKNWKLWHEKTLSKYMQWRIKLEDDIICCFTLPYYQQKNVKREAVFWTCMFFDSGSYEALEMSGNKRAAAEKVLSHLWMPMPGKDMKGTTQPPKREVCRAKFLPAL